MVHVVIYGNLLDKSEAGSSRHAQADVPGQNEGQRDGTEEARVLADREPPEMVRIQHLLALHQGVSPQSQSAWSQRGLTFW